MAAVNWVGGTHRLGDPGVWTPMAPGPGDAGVVTDGTIIALHQTVGPYTLVLTADGQPPATLDAHLSSLTGTITDDYVTGDSDQFLGSGAVNLVGHNLNSGTINAGGEVNTDIPPALLLDITDVTAADGDVVQRGILTNTGTIDVDDHYGPYLTIDGDADAELVNNGTISAGGSLTVGVAVLGKGQVVVESTDPYEGISFAKAVAKSQTVDPSDGLLQLLDPIDFRATIVNFASDFGEIVIDQTITAASFIKHVLTLYDGQAVVGELRFSNEVVASDLLIEANTTQTVIGQSNGSSLFYSIMPNITVSTTGSTPALPPINVPPALPTLPGTGPDLTLTTGDKVASGTVLDGYTAHLAGSSASTAPSVDIASVTLGAGFQLVVDTAGDTPQFGSLGVVGQDRNNGTIVAHAGSLPGAATLAINITDVTAPDGVTIQAGVLNNHGTIEADAGSTVRITGAADSTLINAGTVTALGILFIGPSVTGSGIMSVGNPSGVAGSLELGGSLAAGQKIDLSAGTLTIDDAQHILGTLNDFSTLDTIVLKGVDVTQLTYSHGALRLDGGADGTLHFHPSNGVTYSKGSFVLSHSGGDTIITTPVHT